MHDLLEFRLIMSLEPDRTPPSPRKAKPARSGARHKADAVNAALRRAYESTLDETIPDTMMDLLSKLD